MAEINRAKAKCKKTRDANLAKDMEIGFHIPISPFGGKHFSVLPAAPKIEVCDAAVCTASCTASCHMKAANLKTVTMYPGTSVLAQPSIWLRVGDLEGLEQNKQTFTMGVEGLGGVSECVTADWPSAQEYKAEGDGRIPNDPKYNRFLPVPRKPGNETVNFQQLKFLDQHDFDMVHCGSSKKKPTEEDVFFLEFEIGMDDGFWSEESATHFLGVNLIAELDPEGIYSKEMDFQ